MTLRNLLISKLLQMKRVAVEDSITREKPMCESTLLAFRHATSRIIDLCLSIDDNSDQNLMKLAKAVRSNNSSVSKPQTQQN